MTLKIHANGRLLRKILLGAILIFCAAMENETRVGAQEIPPSATPAELAAAIARTMNATKPNRGPNSPIAQEFGAHDNVVEIRTILRDAQGFATLAAHREDQRMGTTNYFCKGERRAYIKKGVVLHETVTGPNVGESFEYVIDERTCASLAKPVPTNAATLKKMTEDLAKRLATALPAEETIVGVQFQNEKPVVRDGVIQLVHVIMAPAFGPFFKLKSYEVRGLTQGIFCAKFGDEIRRGVRVHEVYQLEDGTILLDFPIDDSVC